MKILDPLPFPNIERIATTSSRAFELGFRCGHLDAEALMRVMVQEEFPGRIGVVSSFGSESAVLLHILSRVDPNTPVIFLDTGKLFGETLRYRDTLVERLGLTHVRSVRPRAERLHAEDPDGMLFQRDGDRCCALRKVEPLRIALEGFDAWVTGRKTFQGADRNTLPPVESDGVRLKVNPLAHWTRDDIDAYFDVYDLPRHPLEADGFLSIGCMPCTDRVAPGEDVRSGRWRGTGKTECGIHHLRSA